MKSNYAPLLIAICLMIGWQLISRYAGWSFAKYILAAVAVCVIAGAIWLLVDQIAFRLSTKGSPARMILALDEAGREEFFGRVGISTTEDKEYILDLAKEIASGSLRRIVLSEDEQQLSQFLVKFRISEEIVREYALRVRQMKRRSKRLPNQAL